MKNSAALTVMHLSLMRIGLRFMPELSFRKTSTITQACNIPSQEVIFSDVFLMLCQIGVDVFNFLSFFIFLFENQYFMLFLFSFKL